MSLSRVHRLARIGIALSSEDSIDKLLEMIVDEARKLTGADAGTLYIVDEERDELRFEILHNDSLKVRMGGTSGLEANFPPVPMRMAGKPNHTNVSSYVALTDKIVNIPDIYQAEGFDFSGSRTYDQATGYRTRSMVVIPMKDHEDDIIGVLQLLNARKGSAGEVVSFDPGTVDLVASLASQAAVALTNRKLIQDSRDLFDSFIKSIASAIDEKSPYTGGHIRRVTELTMMIAERINGSREGPFEAVHFDDDEMEELHVAAWMHDIGKIVLPEHVVSKSTKLESVFDRIQLIQARFELIGQTLENEYLRRKLALVESGASAGELEREEQDYRSRSQALEEDREFLFACNVPCEDMGKDAVKQLKQIAGKTFRMDGSERHYLTPEELESLSIRKGSLTTAERTIMENHASVSIRMLNGLSFPKKLGRVPEYAGAHHEKLDGSGYPLGLKGDQLSLQARIIAIADVFESLTARDRPYREPTDLEEVMGILGRMKDRGHIDPDIYDLIVGTDLCDEYAQRILGLDAPLPEVPSESSGEG